MAGTYQFSLVDPRQISDWNDYVDQHPHGWICHRAEWFGVIQDIAPRTEPRCLLVRQPTDGRIAALLPLILHRPRFGSAHLISLPYATLCDPLAENPEALAFLFSQLAEIMHESKADQIDIRTFHTAHSHPRTPLSRNVLHLHHEIDLTKSEKDLLASFDGGCIRNRIKKALKGPLTVRLGDTAEDLRNFYTLYVASRQRLGLPAQPWNYFAALWEHLLPCAGLELLVVEHEGRAVGGLLTLLHGKRASAEVLAYDEAALVHCANHLVFWAAIRRAKEQGRTAFDFGRTPTAEPDLVLFKDRWGTTRRDLPILHWPPRPHRSPTKPGLGYSLTRHFLRRAPGPAYHLCSELFYRWSR